MLGDKMLVYSCLPGGVVAREPQIPYGNDNQKSRDSYTYREIALGRVYRIARQGAIDQPCDPERVLVA